MTPGRGCVVSPRVSRWQRAVSAGARGSLEAGALSERFEAGVGQQLVGHA